MTLAAYQQALADLISSPQRCLAARADPQSALSGYALSELERWRVASIVQQAGMSTNCSLYRSNRVTPIYTLLHFSCLALGDELEVELNGYWESVEFSDLQFQLEIARFAQFLKRRVEQGAVRLPWLPALLDFELARNELRFLPRRRLLATLSQNAGSHGGAPARDAVKLSPLVRLSRFPCDAPALLTALAAGLRGVIVKPAESYLLSSVLRDAAPEVLPIEAKWGRHLMLLRDTAIFPGSDSALAELVAMGLVVA